MRKLHLTKRASAMNIANKSSSEKTIINIQKIEQVIVMWRKIKYLTKLRENKSKNNRHSNRHIREIERHLVVKKPYSSNN